MKNEVIKYFQEDRSFEAGRQLYLRTPGASRSYSRELNFQTDTANNRNVLHYELGKLYGITESQIKRYSAPKRLPSAPDVAGSASAIDSMSYPDLKSRVAELELTVENQKKATLIAALKAHEARQESEEIETPADESGKANETPEGAEPDANGPEGLEESEGESGASDDAADVEPAAEETKPAGNE